MKKEKPLSLRIYFDDCYAAICRTIGYAGCQYRELDEKLEPLRQQFGKVRVDSATYYLVAFEGQMTVKPPPLARVELRAEARKHCWQLLGPPPEHPLYYEFYPDRKPKEESPAEQKLPEPSPKPKRRGKGKK